MSDIVSCSMQPSPFHRSAYASSLVAQAAWAQPLPWGWHALDDFRGNPPCQHADLRSIIENKVWYVPIRCCLVLLMGGTYLLLKYWDDPLLKGTHRDFIYEVKHWKWELGRILILGRDHERGQAVVKELREVTLQTLRSNLEVEIYQDNLFNHVFPCFLVILSN